MATEAFEETQPVMKASRMNRMKIAALTGLATVGTLSAPVAAEVDINATIAPILGSVVELIPSLIELIVAAVPAIVVLAIVGFIVGFLDQIIASLKLR